MNIIVILIIAVSLSMDAFSLSLLYGTLNLDKKYIILLSTIVGIYHFFMPIIGLFVGHFIENIIPMNNNFLLFLVLSVIGIQMIIESFKHNNEIKYMKLYELILFGLAVSIDSFSIGIGLNSLSSNIFIPAFVFSFTSFLFTYFGLVLGKKIKALTGRISTILGGLMLIIIGIFYLF